MIPERVECADVRWHCGVSQEPSHRRLQPPPLFGYRAVHSAPQLLLDLPEFGRHLVAARLAVGQEGSRSGLAANEREPQEGESL